VSGCASSGPTTARKVQVDVSVVNGVPVVSPDPVSAREGDRVHWVFHGSEAKELKVIFTNVTDSPFNWSEKKGASVGGTVKEGAAKRGASTPYKYGVDVDGAVLDPKIIIDHN
jgi:plastocyanin